MKTEMGLRTIAPPFPRRQIVAHLIPRQACKTDKLAALRGKLADARARAELDARKGERADDAAYVSEMARNTSSRKLADEIRGLSGDGPFTRTLGWTWDEATSSK